MDGHGLVSLPFLEMRSRLAFAGATDCHLAAESVSGAKNDSAECPSPESIQFSVEVSESRSRFAFSKINLSGYLNSR